MSTTLNQGRRGHVCIKIPGLEKVLVAGGDVGDNLALNSAEIIDIATGSVTNTQMNSKRTRHGIGIMTIEGEEKVTVFGGHGIYEKLDSMEVYHHDTQSWEMLDSKLSKPKSSFGYLIIQN